MAEIKLGTMYYDLEVRNRGIVGGGAAPGQAGGQVIGAGGVVGAPVAGRSAQAISPGATLGTPIPRASAQTISPGANLEPFTATGGYNWRDADVPPAPRAPRASAANISIGENMYTEGGLTFDGPRPEAMQNVGGREQSLALGNFSAMRKAAESEGNFGYFGKRFLALTAIHAAVGTYAGVGRGSVATALAGTQQDLLLKAALEERKELGGLVFGGVGALGDLREDPFFAIRTQIGAAQQAAEANDKKTKIMGVLPGLRLDAQSDAEIAGASGAQKRRLEAQAKYDVTIAKAREARNAAQAVDQEQINQAQIQARLDFAKNTDKRYGEMAFDLGKYPMVPGERGAARQNRLMDESKRLQQGADDQRFAQQRAEGEKTRKENFESIEKSSGALRDFTVAVAAADEAFDRAGRDAKIELNRSIAAAGYESFAARKSFTLQSGVNEAMKLFAQPGADQKAVGQVLDEANTQAGAMEAAAKFNARESAAQTGLSAQALSYRTYNGALSYRAAELQNRAGAGAYVDQKSGRTEFLGLQPGEPGYDDLYKSKVSALNAANAASQKQIDFANQQYTGNLNTQLAVTDLRAKGRPIASRADEIFGETEANVREATNAGGPEQRQNERKSAQIGVNRLEGLRGSILDRLTSGRFEQTNGLLGNTETTAGTGTKSFREDMQEALRETNQKLEDLKTELRGL